MNYLIFAVLLLLEPFTVSTQSGVCYVVQAVSRVSTRTLYRPGYHSYSTTYACGFLWTRRCRNTHYTSFQQAFNGYYSTTTFYAMQQCCYGFIGIPPDCQAECTGGCLNGGTCIIPGFCTCTPGWAGINCEMDINECNGDHGCDHTCNNVNGSFICSCDPGYELQFDNRTCEDINECQTDNGGCTQTCRNTAGSYRCSCENGYELTNDNHTCIDIGECLIGIHNCSQTCVESPGGYECSCSNGYALGGDGVTCEDIDECTQGTSGCSQGCRNTDGSFICTCNEGYQTHHDDPTFCVDIDECVNLNGGCQHVCKNSISSYQCLCHNGHLLGADKHSCEDIDECSNSNGGCQYICTNIIGSYYCSCAAGYSLDDNGHSCSFIEVTKSSTGVIKSLLRIGESNLPNSAKDDSSNTAVPIASTISVVLVVVIVLLVVIVCVIIRYQRKRNPPLAVSPVIAIPNNTASIAATKKEAVTENSFDNPTYSGLKVNNSTLPKYDHNMLQAPQNYEIPYDDVSY